MFRSALCRICFSLALAFVVLHSSLAAPPQTQVSSPQAATLLQKSLAALVGNASISDATLTGTVRRIAGSDNETGTATVLIVNRGDSRLQLVLPSGNRSETRSTANSVVAGSWSGPDGVQHPIAYHNLVTDSGLFPFFTLAAFAINTNSVVTLVGQETRNGQSVIHLTASQQFPSLPSDAAAFMQRLSQTEIFLDPVTYLPVALTFNTHSDDNALLDISVEIQFSDYRLLNGVQCPFHIQKSLNASLFLDLQFQTITLNTGLSAAQVGAQ